jgi:signal transduction histidine kinase
MNRKTDLPDHQKTTLIKQENIGRVLIQTGGFGGIFGLFVMLLISSRHGFTEPIFFYILGVPLFCAIIAILAGLSNAYLDRFLQNHGLFNSKTRQPVTIGLTIIIAISIGLSPAAYFGFLNLKEQFSFVITAIIIGFILGMAVAMIDDYLWNMRRKVLTLELENKYLAELTEKDEQLQETFKNLIIAEERNRMARELHDSVSQGIQGILYTAHSLKEHLRPKEEQTGKILEHLLITAETTLNELRTMIFELKPSLLEERGLAEAVKIQCDLFARRLKVKCNFAIGKISGITAQQEMAVYRIVQEALANIQQHAGADQINVSLYMEENNLKLIIKDNGKGFDIKEVTHGNGLDNMRSRCLENNGVFSIESIPNEGTTIEAIFSVLKKESLCSPSVPD